MNRRLASNNATGTKFELIFGWKEALTMRTMTIQNEQPRAVSIMAVFAILVGLSLMVFSFHASGPGWDSQVSHLERAAAASDMIWGAI